MLVYSPNFFQYQPHPIMFYSLAAVSAIALSISSCMKAALGAVALIASLGLYKPLWNFGCKHLRDAQSGVALSILLFSFPLKICKAPQEKSLVSIYFQVERARKQMEEEPEKPFKYLEKLHANKTRTELLKISEYVYKMVGPHKSISYAHHKGAKPKNEDLAINATIQLRIQNKVVWGLFLGVFDGHGGINAAKFLQTNIVGALKEQLLHFNSDGITAFGVSRAFHKTFFKLKKQFKEINPGCKSGTTAVICLIIKNFLFAANVGDSRAVAWDGEKTIRLTEDALPEIPHYRKRIEKLGGEVIQRNKTAWIGDKKIVKLTHRIGGKLAPGTAFGDFDLKGVSTKPQITLFNLNNFKSGSFIVLASDGIWDVCGSKHVVDVIKQSQKNVASYSVIQDAWKRGSDDNMSASILFLN